MKRLLILFSVLAVVFAGVWIWKLKTPGDRPDSFKNGITANFWWKSMGEAEEVDTNWKLADGVPHNYIPVPGNPELYMVVDEDGYITEYKKRVKNAADEWTWESVNPDIPENYEAVPGLKDVYKVTYDDGSVKYFKYVRNKDDTYAFVEVDAKGNIIGMETPQDGSIPDNYERVDKNKYAVKNDAGVTIAYKERVVNPNTASGFGWQDITEDDLASKNAETIANAGFNLDTDITGTGDSTGGNRPYSDKAGNGEEAIPTLMPKQEIVASEGNTGTFTFVKPETETVELGPTYVEGYTIDMTGHDVQLPDGSTQLGGGVTGQVRLADGTTGVISINDEGKTIFTPDKTPQGSYIEGGESTFISSVQEQVVSGNNGSGMPTVPPDIAMTGGQSTIDLGFGGNSMGISHEQNGGMVSRQTINTRVQEGNDLVSYQEIIETYTDSSGKESKRSLGKKEVDRVSLSAGGGISGFSSSSGSSNISAIASNINDEYSRIVNEMFNNGGNFNTSIPAKLRELINKQRIENGKQPLLAPSGNDSIYLTALCRACMMALTGSSSKDMTAYGSLMSMCGKYGVPVNSASESLLITSPSNAETIHAMMNSSSAAISSDSVTHVSIGIAEMNGRIFICEIFY